MSIRAGALTGVILLAVALAVTFAPASYRGSDCGTWMSPEWTQTRADMVVETVALQQATGAISGQGQASQSAVEGYTQRAYDTVASCDSTLDTRRYLALIGVGLAALAVPAGWLLARRGTTRNPAY